MPLVGKIAMSENRTTRQTFLTQVGATLAAVMTFGLLSKGSSKTTETSQANAAPSDQYKAVPESRAVPRQTSR